MLCCQHRHWIQKLWSEVIGSTWWILYWAWERLSLCHQAKHCQGLWPTFRDPNRLEKVSAVKSLKQMFLHLPNLMESLVLLGFELYYPFSCCVLTKCLPWTNIIPWTSCFIYFSSYIFFHKTRQFSTLTQYYFSLFPIRLYFLWHVLSNMPSLVFIL